MIARRLSHAGAVLIAFSAIATAPVSAGGVGVCCLNPGCVETTAEICRALGGDYRDGLSCQLANCGAGGGPAGACCIDPGCVRTTAGTCRSIGGRYQGDTTSCQLTNCGRRGDANLDGCTDLADLLMVLASWGVCPPPAEGCDADLDQNGVVELADLLVVLENWGCG